MKKFLALLLFFSLAFTKATAQDTLHIYYQNLNTKIVDTNETKIKKWAKSLGGKKVDLQVLCYYNDKEFKKYSQERSDELFLVLNRQARDLINITSNGPVKGAKSQRSKVDIVYTFQGQAPAPAVNAAPAATASKPAKSESAKAASEHSEKIDSKKEEKEEKGTAKKSKEKPAAKKEEPAAAQQSGTVSESSSNPNGMDEVNSAPTTTVSENEPLKVMVNGEWVEYQNGKPVKKKKK